MPELPEVETTRRCLEPDLVGRTITNVTVARQRMVRRQPRPMDFGDRLIASRIVDLRRKGKFLLADTDGDVVWVTHLGMSGRVAIASTGAERSRHTNVIVALDSGREFRLVDPRTFGFVAAWTPEELSGSSIGRLGPDAFTELPRSSTLAGRLATRTAPIKSLLLDQAFLAGLGNIYADEALHRAGVAPQRPARDLKGAEVAAMRKAIKATLEAGLRWGGTSLDDLAYLLPDGRSGQYLERLRVYGRAGEPCNACGTPIQRAVLRQRSTHWCPSCQI